MTSQWHYIDRHSFFQLHHVNAGLCKQHIWKRGEGHCRWAKKIKGLIFPLSPFYLIWINHTRLVLHGHGNVGHLCMLLSLGTCRSNTSILFLHCIWMSPQVLENCNWNMLPRLKNVHEIQCDMVILHLFLYIFDSE